MNFPFRYVIYALSTSCITLLYALRLAFHSTIICQLEESKENFLHDETSRQYIFQSVGFGLALGLVPLHFLDFLGTRKVTAIFGFVGIVASLFYPSAHDYGLYASFVARFFQGLPLVLILWLVAKIGAEWTPKSEMALSIAVLTSTYQLAPFVGSITAAEMCESFNWRYTYYFLAFICTIAHFVFFIFYTDDVRQNRFTSEEEKLLITQGKQEKSKNGSPHHVPYSKLLTDSTVWATWFSNLAFFSSILVFLQYGPIYIHQVLGFSRKTANYSAGFAHILCLLTKIGFGELLDRSKVEMTKKLKIAWALVEIISIGFILLVIFIADVNVKLASIVLFIAIHGIAIVIIVKTQVFHTAEHSHILANGNSFCVVLCLFLQPLVIKFFVETNTLAEWNNVFIFHAVLIFISVVLFVIGIDAKPAKWTGIQPVETELLKA